MAQTINGYDPFLVVSALQKAIRRGQEPEALHWASELNASNWTGALLTRLRTIAYEDVGIADMTAVIYAQQAIDIAIAERPHGRHQLAFINCVLALCRAKKSRIADHAVFALLRRMRGKTKPAIPDEAYDKHTYAGMKMGRGFKHFLQEDRALTPMDPEFVDTFEGDYTEELKMMDDVPKWKYGKPWLRYGEPLREKPVAPDAPPEQPRMFAEEADRELDQLFSEMPPHSSPFPLKK